MADLEKVKSMVEFYFSDAAFRRDRFLRAKAAENKDGCAFCVPPLAAATRASLGPAAPQL